MVHVVKALKSKKEEKFLKFVKNRKNVRNVLIIRNGLIGDVVSVTSVFNRIIHTFPYARIDTVTGPSAVPVFDHFPCIREVFPFTYNYSLLSTLKQIPFFLKFREKKYDLVLVQETNPHFSIMAKLTGSKFIAGFQNACSFLYDHTVTRQNGKIAVAEAATVRGWTIPQEHETTGIWLSREEKGSVREKLIRNGISDTENVVIIHVGSSKPDSERQWSLKRFAEVADHIIETRGAAIVFTGIARDSDGIEKIRAHMKHQSVVSFAGKTNPRELMALCALARLVIGPDTGIIHIATALRTPVIMLMGVSDPEDTGPYAPESMAIVVRVKLPCSPCINSNPKPAQWEICKNLRPVHCMEQISTDMALMAVDRALDKRIEVAGKAIYSETDSVLCK